MKPLVVLLTILLLGVYLGFPPPVFAQSALPYPYRSVYQLKDLVTDFWGEVVNENGEKVTEYKSSNGAVTPASREDVINNNAGGIASNITWWNWEPSVEAAVNGICTTGKIEYEGRCFIIDQRIDEAIKAYSNAGLRVTGILYGVPNWARTNLSDSNPVCSSENGKVFCTPDNPADFARFAGMIARRYNGQSGNGRVANFVIMNEVNHSQWFDTGCRAAGNCTVEGWVGAYADSYNAAYDRIIAEQPSAKVLVSLENGFDTGFDRLNGTPPQISVKTFLQSFVQKAGDRAWGIAYHSYTTNLIRQDFSQDDLPYVTFGNLGVLVGWLRATFPNTPSAWEVHLTEEGLNSRPGGIVNEPAQAGWLCNAFRNILGTPGIETFVYSRMKDHPTEEAGGLYLGLTRIDNNAWVFKPAWSTWALANRMDIDPPQLSCGFDQLPYLNLQRGFRTTTQKHWASSRLLLPANEFNPEAAWRLLRYPYPDTTMLYECKVGHNDFLSPAANCEGQLPMGPVGYVYNNPVAGTVPLYRCYSQILQDHMVSSDPACEGYNTERLLGYALPGTSPTPPRCSVSWNVPSSVSANTQMTVSVTKQSSEAGWNYFSLYLDGQRQSGGSDSWTINSSLPGRHFLEFRVNDYQGYGMSPGIWPDLTCSPIKSFDSIGVTSVKFNNQSLELGGTPVSTILNISPGATTLEVPVEINYSTGSPRNLVIRFIYQPPVVATPIPTAPPIIVPTPIPTQLPVPIQTPVPTEAPTVVPTIAPTEVPTLAPTEAPTEIPVSTPTPAPVTVVSTVFNGRVMDLSGAGSSAFVLSGFNNTNDLPVEITDSTGNIRLLVVRFIYAPDVIPTAEPTAAPTASSSAIPSEYPIPTQLPTPAPTSASTPEATSSATPLPTGVATSSAAPVSIATAIFSGKSLDLTGTTIAPVILTDGAGDSYDALLDITDSSGLTRHLLIKFKFAGVVSGGPVSAPVSGSGQNEPAPGSGLINQGQRAASPAAPQTPVPTQAPRLNSTPAPAATNQVTTVPVTRQTAPRVTSKPTTAFIPQSPKRQLSGDKTLPYIPESEVNPSPQTSAKPTSNIPIIGGVIDSLAELIVDFLNFWKND